MKWLIVGNASYNEQSHFCAVDPVKASVKRLVNVINTLLSDSSVNLKVDITNQEFHTEVISFYRECANSDAIPVFYYCGHGKPQEHQ